MNKTERKIVKILISQMSLLECCAAYMYIWAGADVGDTKIGILTGHETPSGMEAVTEKYVMRLLAKRINETEIPEPLDNFSTV